MPLHSLGGREGGGGGDDEQTNKWMNGQVEGQRQNDEGKRENEEAMTMNGTTIPQNLWGREENYVENAKY